jgi:hypothetical protein
VRRCLVLALAACVAAGAACGGSTAAHDTNRAAAPAPLVAAQPRCVVAGRIVAALDAATGAGSGSSSADHAAAVADLCHRDAWPADAVECVAAAAEPDDIEHCLDHLAPGPHEALTALRLSWAPDDLDTALVGAPDPLAITVNDDDSACASALADPARFPPAIALAAPDRSWASALRGVALAAACPGWTAAARNCLGSADGSDAVAGCVHDATDGAAIVQLVGAADAVVARMAAGRAHPGTIACERAAAEHYRDAAWAGKLSDDVDADQRRKLIAGSRTAMTKACRDDSWSADLRACLVADGGEPCFVAAGVPGATWGFPAIGVFAPTGLAACDAYANEVAGMLACPKLPASSKQNLARSIQQSLQRFAAEARDHREGVADECDAARDVIREMESNVGCAP